MGAWWRKWVPGLVEADARIEMLEGRLAQANLLYDGTQRRVIELQALLDVAQAGEREARREAMETIKKIADWEARSLGRRPIFDPSTPDPPRPPITMPAPRQQRPALRAQTRAVMQEWMKTLEPEAAPTTLGEEG